MLIPLKEMYLGETAEISSLEGEAADKDLKRLRSMGIREGQLIDLLHFDPLVTKKLLLNVNSSRIAFNVALAEHIKVRPLRNCYEALKTLAHHDQLTGCLNRHAANDLLNEEFNKFSSQKIPATLLIADIDHFKSINDNYGHPAGDAILKEFARITRKVLRRSDALCRWGGEEFLFLLRGTWLDEAQSIAERIRTTVETAVFPQIPAERKITISIGGCALPPQNTPEQLVADADACLYQAKQSGRNQVILCSQH